MKKYIISLVLMRVMPVLAGNGEPELSIQNVVNVISGDGSQEPQELYRRCVELAKIKHPEHNVVVRTIIDLDEAMEDTID